MEEETYGCTDDLIQIKESRTRLLEEFKMIELDCKKKGYETLAFKCKNSFEIKKFLGKLKRLNFRWSLDREDGEISLEREIIYGLLRNGEIAFTLNNNSTINYNTVKFFENINRNQKQNGENLMFCFISYDEFSKIYRKVFEHM